MERPWDKAARFLKSEIGAIPPTALVLGSGWDAVAEGLRDTETISYDAIPGYPKPTAPGHRGALTTGFIDTRKLMVFRGRLHLYEGHSLEEVTFPVRLMKSLGVTTLLLANAAGGIDESFVPGDLMIVTDHINATGRNPLMGPNETELGPRFPDMTEVYSAGLRDKLIRSARERGIPLREGVYVWTTGPSFETPAEIRMYRSWGAQAVGMSTVPEAIVANHAGIATAALSMITNLAAGMSGQRLGIEEVFETARRSARVAGELLAGFLTMEDDGGW